MVRLTPDVESALTYQQYGKQPEIAGAFYLPLKRHHALEGDFMEYLRCTDGKVEGLPAPFEPRQLSCSWAAPGRINAFHLHPKREQNELWCAIAGELLVWLADVRADSPTSGNRRRYVLSAAEPGLLYIPSGVAHGYRAGVDGALLLYATDDQFDPADSNEGRLPWDYWGAELWDINRG